MIRFLTAAIFACLIVGCSGSGTEEKAKPAAGGEKTSQTTPTTSDDGDQLAMADTITMKVPGMH